MRHLKFPVAILIHESGFITAAANNHAPVTARLPEGFLTETEGLQAKLTGDVTGQKTDQGELGGLTQQQIQGLATLHHCMSQARKTAGLAFPGQTVKLYAEFQVGEHAHNDLASFLERTDIVLASVQNDKNLPALKSRGWADADTTKFSSARQAFGPAETYREHSKGDAKGDTVQKNLDALDLYDRLLTIQNAADLEYPATEPANAGTRDEFRLGLFPPHNATSHEPAPAPPPSEPTQ